MNQLIDFFSMYTVDWVQNSLLFLGIAGALGLLVKKLTSRNKKHWTETNEHESVAPLSMPNANNYDSMMTEDVNNLLMPKNEVHIDKYFNIEKKSIDSVLEAAPNYYNEDEEVLVPDITHYEKVIDVPFVEVIETKNSDNFNFLDSFDEDSKLPDVLVQASVKENEKTLPKISEKNLDSLSDLKLPSLTDLYSYNSPNVASAQSSTIPVLSEIIYYTGLPTLVDVVEDVKSNEIAVFTPINTTESDIKIEEKFEFTRKYHLMIDEALYFDSKNNKDSALNSLLKAEKLIENVRINFYLKIAIQSYRNAITSNALPSIISHFYIIEKEKLIKEDAQKKQEANVTSLKDKKISQIQEVKDLSEKNNVYFEENEQAVISHGLAEAQDGAKTKTDLLEIVSKPIDKQEITPDSMRPDGSVELADHSYSVESEIPIFLDDNFNRTPVLGEKTVDFEDAFVKSVEEVQQEVESEKKELKEFLSEVEGESINLDTVVSRAEQGDSLIQFAAFEDPVEHDVNQSLLGDSELSPVAEIIQQEIENTDIHKYILNQDNTTENTPIVGALFDAFKPIQVQASTIIHRNIKHSVWVNWMSNENGKMNLKNDMIELNSLWGTKTAIEDLHQQLQFLVGPDNQFSVVSVFEVK